MTRGSWTRPLLLELAVTVGALAGVMATFARFVAAVEQRPGVVLPDPVLASLVPRDLTWLTFALLYASLPIAVASLAPRPALLLRGLRAYAVMVILRMAVMSVTPLDPPAGMIPLQDPVVQWLGSGAVLTRDLFFSGHTATLALLALAAPGPRARAFLGVATVVVAACLLGQAVHYTLDVVAAPFFAYAAWRVAAALRPEVAGALVRGGAGAPTAGAGDS